MTGSMNTEKTDMTKKKKHDDSLSHMNDINVTANQVAIQLHIALLKKSVNQR